MTSNSDEYQENGGSYPPSRKLQVLFLASEWGSTKGGLSTINRELAINVAKYAEVDVFYFVPQCSDEDRNAALGHKINLVQAKRRSGMNELQWLSFLPQNLRIDVVVGHGVKLGPQAQVISEYQNCKWVQVVHTAPEELAMHKDYPNPLLSGEIKHATEVELCKMADLIVSIGPKLNEAFRSYLCSKDEIVFNFTPGIFREFSDVQQVSDRTGKFRVLLFGRGDAEDFNLKGFDIAAKAVELSNTHLIFVGAPKEKLEEVKNRFLECDIHANNLTVRSFLRNREDMKDLLREADVAIMPSRTEGFGLTGLEALSAGLPILVSKNSGFAEALSGVLFGPSFVVDSDSPKVWAEAIKKVMDRKRSKRLGESEALRTSYEKEYSWEKQSEELIAKMISMVRDCSDETEQRAFQQTGISTEHQPGTLPVVVRFDSVTFQNGLRGDSKQVMNEMSKHFFNTKAADIPPKELPRCLHYYLEGVLDLIEKRTEEGSLIITVECRTLEILERLWDDYRSGHLNAVAEDCLLTDDIKMRFQVESVKLKTTILEEDYLACKLFLTSVSAKSHGLSTKEEEMLPQHRTPPHAHDETQTQSAEELEPTTLHLAVNYGDILPNSQRIQQEENWQELVSEDLLVAEEADTFSEELPRYLQNINVIHGSRPTEESENTVRLAVECGNLEMLEHLWHDYCSGHLNAVAEKCFLTDEIKRRFHVESVNLHIIILEKDYLACKEFLSKKPQHFIPGSQYAPEMALQPFSDEQLNFFKFSSIVLNEFPNALRQTFKTMWDNTLGHHPGYLLWDDSTAVRNLFASTEGGRTRVPTNLSYSEWDCTALFQATIYAQSFALPASTGHHTTLSDLYVKPRGVPHGSFHTSVVSPGGNDAETYALAIDQLRLLRNFLCHSISSEINKVTFDECVKRAKDAFQALGVTTAPIDAVGGLDESDFPTNEIRKLKKGVREETRAYINFLEGMSSDINELKTLLNAIKQTVKTTEGDIANIAILEEKINELKVAQDERDDKNANECTSILEGVSELKSLSPTIKQATSGTANKEDIAMLNQEIDEMKKTNKDRDEEDSQAYTKILEGVSSDINVLKKNIEGDAADKEEIALLEQKIAELKVALDERDAQTNNSGAKPSIPRTCLPPMVPNFTGRQSECKEIIGHVSSESTRLVSIWGSPGFGKTSVAIAVGHALQSEGFPVWWVSLRGLQSKADLTSKLLSFVSQPARNAQPSVQCISPDDELCQLISDISERSVFILDNADDVLESGLQKVKEEVMQLLEEILSRNQRVTFAVTLRESFEFMNVHFQGHQGVRIRPLDEASAQTLLHELLPDASASDCTQIRQICGHVPLAMKLLCSLISEDSVPPSEFLDDFMKSPTKCIVEMLDKPDYQNSHRLRFLFYSSFHRLTAQEQEALVSLSILPENFSTEVAMAVLGKTRVSEATKILQSLRRKSLLDLSSKPGSFTMHKLLQSFAKEKGETEMKETVLNSKGRLNTFYISLFEKLNEQFLTGHSMTAFVAFYEDKQSIVQSLIQGCSDVKRADSVFDVLVKAELFLDSLFWSVSEATNFFDIYDSALKASNLLGKDKYYRQLLTSRAFGEVTWGPKGNTMQLLSKRNEIQASSSPFPADEKGKHLCYLGIHQLVTRDTESGVQCLHEALSFLDNCNNPEQTILRLVIFQFLIFYYQSLNDSTSVSYFYNKAHQECHQGGDSQLLIIPSMKTTTEETDGRIKFQKDTGILPNQPLKFEIVFLLSRAGKFISDPETEQYLCNVVLQILKEIETKVPGSLGLFSFYRNVAELLNSFNKIEDPVKLYERRINYHETALKQCKENFPNDDNFGSFNQVHSEALAKCYLDLGEVYHRKMNYSEALRAKQRALEITIKLFGEEHASTADSYCSLGATQHSLGDFTSALESNQRALHIRLKLFGEKHASTANSYHNLGATQHSLGDFTSALESTQRALHIRFKLFGEKHASTADSYQNLGTTQHSLGDFTSALESKQRALRFRLKLFGEEHACIADSYDNLGATQHFLGDLTSAFESAQRALHIRLKLFGEEHASTADSYHNLKATQHSLGDFTSALESAQRAFTFD